MRKAILLSILAAALLPGASWSNDLKLEGFIRSLVDLKTVGNTCSSYLSNSPLAYMNEVDKYFLVLGQPVPQPIDAATSRSLSRLVKQHAAYICSQKMNQAYSNYSRHATVYMESKPDNWPPAPQVRFPKWCNDSLCSDYQ